MPPDSPVRLTDPAFQFHRVVNGVTVYQGPTGDVVQVHAFDLPPDLSPPRAGLSGLRQYYRDLTRQASGAIIEVELVDISGVQSAWTIIKVPQQPSGMIYVASITIPFRSCSYVVKTVCREVGMTGMRDAVIFARMQQEGRITLTESGATGWFADPYDARLTDGLARNLSEDPSFDDTFPQHPLTRARRTLSALRACIRLSPELLTLPRFGRWA